MNDLAGRGSSFSKTESDYELIKAVGAGDVVAFEMLIERYRDPVLNFIFKYTGDKFGAEDIAQEVFLRIYQSASEFEPRGKVSTWIFKIAYNLSVNEVLRRRRFTAIAGFDEHEAEPQTPNDTALKDLAQEAMNTIRRLPEKQRAALLLRVNDDLSYAEISNVLSTSISGVESLLFRARENLRKLLIRETKE